MNFTVSHCFHHHQARWDSPAELPMDPDDYEMDWFEGAEDDRHDSTSFIEDALRHITFEHLKGPVLLFLVYMVAVGAISVWFYKLHAGRRGRRKTKRQRQNDRKADAARKLAEGLSGAGDASASGARSPESRARLRKLWVSVKRKQTRGPLADLYASERPTRPKRLA